MRRTPPKPIAPVDLEALLLELHSLADKARELGVCITWFEPNELHGLDPDAVEEVMTHAANEFIAFNSQAPGYQLPLEMDD